VKVSIGAAALVAMILVSGCSSSTPAATSLQAASPQSLPTSEPSTSIAAGELIGSWHRAQTCQELLVAFEGAGLATSHVEWLAGDFFGGSQPPAGNDLCEGARGPLEHSHFFTATGDFGSHDENGQQVDYGDYVVEAANKVAFPSHATEFGYAGDLAVGYAITEGILTFDVVLPEPCESTCKDAYAWALSAFASGPWGRGDVP
jgi:hypothetical protein